MSTYQPELVNFSCYVKLRHIHVNAKFVLKTFQL